jgi:hypothetical protein
MNTYGLRQRLLGTYLRMCFTECLCQYGNAQRRDHPVYSRILLRSVQSRVAWR